MYGANLSLLLLLLFHLNLFSVYRRRWCQLCGRYKNKASKFIQLSMKLHWASTADRDSFDPRTHQLIAHAYTLTSTKPIYKTTITTPSPVRGFSTWLLENKLIHQQRLSTPRDRHYQSHAFSGIRKLFPRIALENLNAKINTIYDDIFNRTIPKASPLYLFYYVVNLGGGVA